MYRSRAVLSIIVLASTVTTVWLTYTYGLRPYIKYEKSIITWTAHGYSSYPIGSTTVWKQYTNDHRCHYNVWIIETTVGFNRSGCTWPDWPERDLWRSDLGTCPTRTGWESINTNSSEAVALSQLNWANRPIYLDVCHPTWEKYSVPYGWWVVLIILECSIGLIVVWAIWASRPIEVPPPPVIELPITPIALR
jgi:hypothetical protein